jgi:dolichol-phosphate mannosyltransferase
MNKLDHGQYISVIVPIYNEAPGLREFHESLVNSLEQSVNKSYEVIYCDDGSSDTSSDLIKKFRKSNDRVSLIRLTRNFGKENALTAGINIASGQAILMIDGDGQHPVELIPKFIDAWSNGASVVIGVKDSVTDEKYIKSLGSKWFYKLIRKMSGGELQANTTDFRLIDRSVQQAFISLNETNRITRGLIDWLGFEPTYIHFTAKKRIAGTATYSSGKLMKLATNSFVSLSPKPLYIFGFLGVGITLGAFILGLSVFIEQLLLGDPLNWKFTGTAMLGILILFLVGIVLLSQGILSLYISHIHSQSKGRPLYVIDYKKSDGITKDRASKT